MNRKPGEQIRPPVVAGSFYPVYPPSLRATIEACYRDDRGPGKLPLPPTRRLESWAGFLVPHAGYAYSGPVAAHAFAAAAALGRPDTVVILGPDHFGRGRSRVAISPAVAWDATLTTLLVEIGLAGILKGRIPGAEFDSVAHEVEHSIEVQLPFLAHAFGPDISFVPLMLCDQSFEAARAVGVALAEEADNRRLLVLASSDLSHYYPDEMARSKDRLALDAFLALDPIRLDEAVRLHGVTMCGPGPAMALQVFARSLGAESGWLLAYGTSADAGGERERVVGYAACAVPHVPAGLNLRDGS